jgi:hypothetical protein
MGEPMKRVVFCIVASLIMASQPVRADVKDDIAGAMAKGDYETAINLVRPLAEAGDAGAQTLLGGFYFYGRGGPIDYAQAEQWFQKAAAQGERQAPDYLNAIKLARQDETTCLTYGAVRDTPGFQQCVYDIGASSRRIAELQMHVEQMNAAQQQAQAAAPRPKHGGLLGIIGAINGTAEYVPPTPPPGGYGAVPVPSVGISPQVGGGVAQGGALFRSEARAGLNKICYYDRAGSQVAITVGSAEFCPRTLN